MPECLRIVAFDVDPISLAALEEGLPGWEVVTMDGNTLASTMNGWNPGAANLMVIGCHADITKTLSLCRFLAYCTSYSADFRNGPQPEKAGLQHSATRSDASILVLMSQEQGQFVQAVLRAGAHTCLMLPIHSKDVAKMAASSASGNQPGRHTLNLERAQTEDPWRDEGGEG